MEIVGEILLCVFEILFEVIFNKKEPKWIRYSIIFVIIMLMLLFMFALFALCYVVIERDMASGIALLCLNLLFFVLFIIKFKKFLRRGKSI